MFKSSPNTEEPVLLESTIFPPQLVKENPAYMFTLQLLLQADEDGTFFKINYFMKWHYYH